MRSFQELPFTYDRSRPFMEQLSDWVGDVFYEKLPEAGFEERDEQIFMAFQLERAFAEKKVIFSEAGVGTGKTIAYLLYAFCYARYMGKPAIIACADEALIEQLVKPEWDIAKLCDVLGINIDVRLAKAQDQYLCVEKLQKAKTKEGLSDAYEQINETIPAFVYSNKPMQSFHHYGDRKTYPELNNETWKHVNWDAFQDCSVCDMRHRCGMTLTREYYKKSEDLIVCSQDFYMEHIWTVESRKRKGQLPLLPEASSVIFDEGHLLEFAAQKALSYQVRHDVLEEVLTRLLQNDVREQVAVLIDDIISQSLYLFEMIKTKSVAVDGSERKQLDLTNELKSEVSRLKKLLSNLEEELVFEGELYTIDEYQLRIVEEHIEMIQYALSLLEEQSNVITWVTEAAEGTTLSIMPHLIEDVLSKEVFSKQIPFVFSSATLSVDGDFGYLAKSLGIENYLSFSVPSPFDYEENMAVHIPQLNKGNQFNQKVDVALKSIHAFNGRSLLLFNTEEELAQFKRTIATRPEFHDYTFLFEGDQELSSIVGQFQNEETTNLCAIHLWEGLDIPGPSLSNVIIWSLPFPPNDPVYYAKRSRSSNPYDEVDMPYMLLRLQQGIGRLIRTSKDKGSIYLLDQRLADDSALLNRIKEVLPKGVVPTIEKY